MSRLDEPVDTASLATTAARVVDAHGVGRRCHLGCPGDGCHLEAWARQVLAERGDRQTR